MKNSLRNTTYAIAAAAASLVVATSVQAEDRKNYPGAFCLEEHDSSPELRYDSHGSAYNSSTSSQNVVCPIVRDNTGSGMDVNDWDLTVNRHGATSVWDFTLWSTNVSGTSGWTSKITVSGGSGDKSLDGGKITSDSSNGLLFIKTRLPGKADITRYSIAES